MDNHARICALDFYTDKCLDLIPLKRWNKTIKDKKGKTLSIGKAPRDSNWRHKEYCIDDIAIAIGKGYNIGWRLTAEDLVLDVDPKNGGDKSLKRIQKRFKVIFEDIAPTVVTGSGGFHFYFEKDPNIKIREVLEDEHGEAYPGIEFKTSGRQVVISGSRHPNGNFYELDEFSEGDRPLLPDTIFNCILRPSKKDGNASSGKLTSEELALALEQLDPLDYSNQDAWLTLMMASHHATDGEGSEEFIQWSIQDSDYRDHVNIIRMRWDSLHTGQDSSITYKTLYQEIKKHGGDITAVDAMSDFDLGDDYKDEFLETEDEISKQLNRLTKKGEVLQMAKDFDAENANDTEVKDILLACINCKGVLEKERALEIIRKKLKLTKAVLNSILKDLSDKQLNDIGEYTAKEVLKVHYNNGKYIIRTNDSQFWTYNDKYWEPLSQDILRQNIIEVIDDVRNKLELPLQTVSITAQVEFLLKGMCATNKDILRLTQEPLPVINCNNGELWIDENGNYELVSHKHTSYLTNCLNVEYDPEATSPLWDTTIREIFIETKQEEDMALHFEEMMGYALQPYKDIACWWLLKGQGANGKSLLCDVLAELAGEFALACSINSLDPSKNSHALASLPRKLIVYDDDLDFTSTLPDGVLKKISERKKLEANPKGQATFSFISCATPILLANKFPAIRDVSNGTRRRAQVIPFTRIFKKAEMDKRLGKKLKTDELPGILNRCLKGLKRLRKRGDFEPPRACIVAAENWLQSGNSFAGFIADCLKITKKDKDKELLVDLYNEYRNWCSDNGVTYILQKSLFKENLLNYGLQMSPRSKNQLGFMGIKLTSIEEDFLN